jgi:hypothetical protein
MVTTTEYLQREAPDIEARRLGLIDTAKALADQPLTLPAQQVAGLTPEQLQAIQLGSHRNWSVSTLFSFCFTITGSGTGYARSSSSSLYKYWSCSNHGRDSTLYESLSTSDSR